jgi:hypothetical protein
MPKKYQSPAEGALKKLTQLYVKAIGGVSRQNYFENGA